MTFSWQTPQVPAKENYYAGDGSAENVIYNYLIPIETNVSDRLNTTLVGGHATIGIGFDLVTGAQALKQDVFNALGFDPNLVSDIFANDGVNYATPAGLNAVQTQEWGYLTAIARDIDSQNVAGMNATMKARYVAYSAPQPNAFASYINGVTSRPQRQTFSFASDQEEYGVFLEVLPIYENIVKNSLPLAAGDASFDQTRENEPLLSLSWNSGKVGGGLVAAVSAGDRAEAWYEIRQNFNKGWDTKPAKDGNGGLAARRYYESQIFGLYANPTIATIDETIDAYQTLTHHRADIIPYEAKFSADPNGNAPETATGYQVTAQAKAGDSIGIQTLAQIYDISFNELQSQVLNELGAVLPELVLDQSGKNDVGTLPFSVRSTNVFWAYSNDVVASAANDLSGSQNHILIGAAYDGSGDTLVGGAGNDILIAGAGNEMLVAGKGNDTIVAGDALGANLGGGGVDTINGGIGFDVFDLQNDGAHDLVEIINLATNNSKGRIEVSIGGVVDILGGSSTNQLKAISGKTNEWSADGTSDGVVYTYSSDFGGDLKITENDAGSLSGATIDIRGFNLAAAVSGGEAGIYLKNQLSVSPVGASTTAAIPSVEHPRSDVVPLDGSSLANVTANDLPETNIDFAGGSEQTFNIGVCTASTLNKTIDVSLTGATSSDFAAVVNGSFLMLDPNGSFDLTLLAGQTQVAFGLIDISKQDGSSDIAGGAQLQLSLAMANPDTQSSDSSLTDSLDLDYVPSVTQANPTPYWPYGAPLQSYDAPDSIMGYYTTGSGGDVSVVGSGARDYFNMVGTGDDSIVTGPGSSTLWGGLGRDIYTLAGGSNTAYLGPGFNTLTGAAGQSDLILGGQGDDQIFAGTKTDLLSAINNADTLQASGSQGDLISVLDGNSTVVGGQGNDFIAAGTGHDVIVLGPGNDTFTGGVEVTDANYDWTVTNSGTNNGNLTFFDINIHDPGYVNSGPQPYNGVYNSTLGRNAGVGNDTIYAGNGNDDIELGNGANDVNLGSGQDTVFGGMGSDTIIAGSGADYIYGGGGTTYLQGGAGQDTLIGGDGNNVIVGGSGASLIFAARGTNDTYAGANLEVNYVDGGSGNDVIYGSSGTDTLIAGTGNTTIYGESGNELIEGGSGQDALVAGSGSATIMAGAGSNTLQGGTGSTSTYVLYGGPASDYLVGGSGTNELYAGDGGTAGSPTTVIAGSDASAQTTIQGGQGVDFLEGGAGTAVIFAGEGGSAGAPTTVIAGSGNATLNGGEGTDLIEGGAGQDVLYAGDGGTDSAPTTLLGGSGASSLFGGGGPAVMSDNVSGHDVLRGGESNDTLIGIGADTLAAGQGNDLIYNHGGTLTAEFGLDSGSASLVFQGGQDNLYFDSGIEFGDVSATAVIGADGAPVLELSDGGSVIDIDGGYVGTLGQVTFADGNSDTTSGASASAMVQASAPAPMDLSSTTAFIKSAVGSDTVLALDSYASGGRTLTVGVTDGELLTASTCYDGNDTISSWGNNSTISGPLTGNGAFIYSAGNAASIVGALNAGDTVVAAGNTDTIAAGVSDSITLEGSNSIARAGTGSDTLAATGSSDTLMSGSGNALFIIGDSSTIIVAPNGSGSDTIQSSVTYTAPSGVNTLVLAGSANITATGNAGIDTFIGGAGCDTLTAGAASTAGTFIAGTGSTTFVVNSSNDVVQDVTAAAATVLASASFTLPSNVNDLVLTGSSNLEGVANAGADTLVSNSGLDSLIGGTGNDLFVVSRSGDIVQNHSTSNSDTVQSSVGFALGSYVNTLVLTGAASVQGSANAGADTLVSNSGVDTLVGGAGNDVFVVNNVNDSVRDTTTTTNNTIISAVNITLPANVNTLMLTGSANLSATGNAAADLMTANLGNDTLTAAGVSSTLVGGAGNDLFVVNSASDVVVNAYSTSNDTLQSSANVNAPINVNDVVLTGSANLTATANSGNDTLWSNTGVDTLYGGSGNDVFVVNNAADVLVNVTASDTILSSVNVTVPAGTTVMPLSGSASLKVTTNSGNDELIGNAGNDTLVATSGNDTLVAGAGLATLVGGSGNDLLVVDNPGDVVTMSGAHGTDTISSSVSYTLPSTVTTLVLTGNANLQGAAVAGNNSIIGNAGADQLTAGSGNDTLISGAGIDTLVGGSAADTFVINNAADLLESVAAVPGNAVISSVNYVMPASIGRVSLSGFGNLTATGSSVGGFLFGNGGFDTLIAGSGLTSMSGGTGADLFLVNNSGDLVVENNQKAFVDTVESSANFTLSNGESEVELILTGAANLTGTAGNSAESILVANTGNDTLQGGQGSDTLVSGSGLDDLVGGGGPMTFVVNNVNDVVSDGYSDVRNSILSSVSITLPYNVNFATLTGGANIFATANSGNDVLTAGAGADTLTAGTASDTLIGGTSIDTFVGGAGATTFVVNNSGDVIVNAAASVSNTVLASASFTLPVNVNIGLLNAAGNFSLTGNAANDTLAGGTGNDTLIAGTGAATLIGGSGNTTFVVDSTADKVIDTVAAALNQVQSTVNFVLPTDVNQLVLTGAAALSGTGNAAADTLVGNSGVDTLVSGSSNDLFVVGNAGDKIINAFTTNSDTLQSAFSFALPARIDALVLTGTANLAGAANADADMLVSNSGVDTLTGGAGNDTFVVNNTADMLVDSSTTASNTALSSVSFTLPTHVNTLTLTGTNALQGAGNTTGADLITANAGNDTLTALGTAFITTLVGGTGNDLFSINNAADVVQVAASGVNDTLSASVSVTAPTHVNTLVLAGTAALEATANAAGDTLVSNSGIDTLVGGAGNDVFVVNNAADVLINVSAGDTIVSSVTYAMPAGVNALSLSLQSGTAGTGNAYGQTLTAGGANDTLVAGGLAATLVGGTASTTYVVNDPSDVVVQANVGAGDTVSSSVNFTLPTNVDTLMLTGAAALDATGNGDGSNLLSANAGNDLLVGTAYATTLNGGAGADTLVAGPGSNLIYAGNGGTLTQPTVVEANLVDSSTAATTIYGGSGTDILDGGSGSDLIVAGTGATTINSGSGSDTAYGNAGALLSDSQSGTDLFNAGAGAETLVGYGGDTLVAGTGTALMTDLTPAGGDGVFQFNAGFGQDTLGTDQASSSGILSFGPGIDPANLAVSLSALNAGGAYDGVSLVLNDGTSSIVVRDALAPGVIGGLVFADGNVDETLAQFMNASGLADQTVSLGGSLQQISFGNGKTIPDDFNGDPIWAFGDDDVITNSSTAPVVAYGANDTISANTVWTGGAGTVVHTAGSASVTLAGASQTVYLTQSNANVVVDQSSDVVVASAGVTGIAIDSFDDDQLPANVQALTLDGTQAGLTGTSNAIGGVLTAAGAFDTLAGGAGSDTLIAGASHDVLVGGSGAETYILHDATDSIQFGTGNASLNTVQTAQSYALTSAADTLRLVGDYAAGAANTQNDLLVASGAQDTLYGGAGTDTLVGATTSTSMLVAGTGNALFEVNTANTGVLNNNAAASDSVTSSVNFTLPTNVNTLTLTGNAALAGQANAGADLIRANAGADTLTAGTGNDTFVGGTGSETLVFNAGFKQDLVLGTANNDVVQFGAGISQSSLTFTAVPGSAGAAASLVIAGDGGAVTLQGGLSPGAIAGISFNGGAPVPVAGLVAPTGRTTVAGAHGNLILSTVNNDSIVGGSGSDTIIAWGSGDTLAAGAGGSLIDAAGASAVLHGGTGADTLDAFGASDTLIAGTGLDALIVNNPTDVVQATAANTQDTLFSSVNVLMPNNLTALSLTGSGNLQATANGGNDVLQANAGADTLYAGSAIDTLIGGTGNDVFVINNASDVVLNNHASSADTIVSSVSDMLPAGVNALSLSGSTALSATGNAGADYLTGVNGWMIADSLISGTGVDTLDGGDGSGETLVINNSNDVVVNTNYYDTIESSVSLNEQSTIDGDTIELTGSANLTLQYLKTFSDSDTLVGNAGNDVITGGMSSEIVGGTGVDTMIGTLGDTVFVITNANDVVEEASPYQSADTVESSLNNFSYQVPVFASYVRLTGSNDSASIASGNAEVDLGGYYSVATGGTGVNTLRALGGYDTLVGGSGTNWFSPSTGDTIVLTAGSTRDLVEWSPFLSYCSLQFDASMTASSLTASVVLDSDGNAGLQLSGPSLLLTVNGAFTSPSTYTYDIGGATLTLNQLLSQVSVASSSIALSTGSIILNGASSTSIVGGAGNDTLYAAGSNVSLIGGSGNQLLQATGAGDYVLGGAGADTLDAYGAGATLVAGSATDTLFATGAVAATFVVNNSADIIWTDTFGATADTVVSSASYALPTNYDIDQLVLTGSAALVATSNGGNDTIVSNTGVDTLDAVDYGSTLFVVNNSSDSIVATSNAYVTVDSAFNYVLPAHADTLVLTGASALQGQGNADADTLVAGSGADTLVSGTGTDSLVGGTGADVFVIKKSTDTIANGNSHDTIDSSVSYTLQGGVGLMSLTGSAALSGTGGALAGTVIANAGTDTLVAGAAVTTLIGGAGNDLFVLNNAADVVSVGSTHGNDTLQASFNDTLAANVSTLVLTGAAALSGTGNAIADVLHANTGSDTLTAGSGVATLVGGTGSDLFVLNNAADVVSVGASHGTDTLQASFNDTLAANVSVLVLTGSAALTGTGNAIADVLRANAGADTLTAGAGVATLVGGAGNDVFVVDNTADTVQSASTTAVDTIRSSVSFTLPTNVNTLVLTGAGALKGVGNSTGADLLTASGRTTADTLVAGNGADTLVSGTGTDSLVGGTGADLFVVNATADAVNVGTTHGVDTVESSVTYTLPANVQYLALTGSTALTGTASSTAVSLVQGGTGADTLVGSTQLAVLEAGSAGAQVLKAASAQAALIGGGAADTLTGGAFKDFLAAGKVADTITSGATSNVVAVNKGDGATVLAPMASSHNVLSLGAGIDTEALTFTKSGNNLVLNDGVAGDSITFTNWYAAAADQTTTTLQVIEAASASYNSTGTDVLRNKPIEEFNFTSLVAAFTAAGSTTGWALSHSMGADTLASSATAAYGGDLAYYDGKNGNLTGMNLAAVQSTLTNASYATTTQTIDPWASISGTGTTLNTIGVSPFDVAADPAATPGKGRATIMPVTLAQELASEQTVGRPHSSDPILVTPASLAGMGHDDLVLLPTDERAIGNFSAWTTMHRHMDVASVTTSTTAGTESVEHDDVPDLAALMGAGSPTADRTGRLNSFSHFSRLRP